MSKYEGKNEQFFISNLAVFEEYRGKGIALKLLQNAEKMAIDKDINRLSLYVESDNQHAKRIYDKFGLNQLIINQVHR